MPEWRALTGQTVDEVRGWGWLNALHPDDRDRSATVWQTAVDTRSTYETEYRVRRWDGEYVWYQARGAAVLDPDDSIREWVGICVNIGIESGPHSSRWKPRRRCAISMNIGGVTTAADCDRGCPEGDQPLSLRLETVLHTLVESAARLCEADKATITRQKDGEFYRAESFGFSSEFMDYVGNVPVVPDRGSAIGRALLEGVVVHIPDVKADSDYTFTEGQKLGDFRAILCVPMLREGVPSAF